MMIQIEDIELYPCNNSIQIKTSILINGRKERTVTISINILVNDVKDIVRNSGDYVKYTCGNDLIEEATLGIQSGFSFLAELFQGKELTCFGSNEELMFKGKIKSFTMDQKSIAETWTRSSSTPITFVFELEDYRKFKSSEVYSTIEEKRKMEEPTIPEPSIGNSYEEYGKHLIYEEGEDHDPEICSDYSRPRTRIWLVYHSGFMFSSEVEIFEDGKWVEDKSFNKKQIELIAMVAQGLRHELKDFDKEKSEKPLIEFTPGGW